MHAAVKLRDATEVQERWDRRYLDADLHPWGREPNATVAGIISGLPLGDALDLGAGDGRNTRWLADHGWRVTAVDISWIALGELLKQAWGKGWDLTTIHADLRSWTPPSAVFDLVLLSFVHLRQPYRARLHRLAAAALRPGGSLVVVAHDRSNVGRGVGGPQDPAVLPTLDEVRSELSGVSIQRAEIVDRPDDATAGTARDLIVVGRKGA